ncbi:pentapeptide repeat-containing protein [Thermogemmatispora sp.]|uniref:pentapeptide repeat-containing protein n=1 Tax=Thermogemmatispora sp. TaxID=1968838 RepID=UPI001D35CBE1|nr:pentapeptide repeat-containing protein [Thermogemmatispora sp.]MBX5449412.1 pentapeptide repeat-containing protein [Thermogemmatispora sp.]
MVETLIIGGVIIFVLAGGLGIFLGLRVQRLFIESVRKQQAAWERAEEARRQVWEQKQQREMAAQKQSLANQVEQLRKAYEERLNQAISQFGVELELARLPRVDETPILSKAAEEGAAMPAHWRPANLYKADLSQRDLSHRYLGRADLRGARLVGANLSMADLSRACLAGADLTRANLTGANLSYADLRDANLSEATLLVADLHQTNLTGARLDNVYSLTEEQLRSAILGPQSRSEAEVEETSPRMPAVRPTRIIPERPAAPPGGSSSLRPRAQESPAPEAEATSTAGSFSSSSQRSSSADLSPRLEEAASSFASAATTPGTVLPADQETSTSPASSPSFGAHTLPEPAIAASSSIGEKQGEHAAAVSAAGDELGQETESSEEDYFSPESLAYMMEERPAGEQPEIPAWLKALETSAGGVSFNFTSGPEAESQHFDASLSTDEETQHAPAEGLETSPYPTESFDQQEEFPSSSSLPWTASTWERAWKEAVERAAAFSGQEETSGEEGNQNQTAEKDVGSLKPTPFAFRIPDTSYETTSSSESEEEAQEASGSSASELPQVPETPFSVPTLDTLPFIEQLVDPLPQSERTSAESLLDPQVTDHIVDTQELRALKKQKSPAPGEQASS